MQKDILEFSHRGLVVSLRNVNGRWDLLVSVGWCWLWGSPLGFVGVMDLIQPLKKRTRLSHLDGARGFMFYVSQVYKNSWEHVWAKYEFWKDITHASYHQIAHIKTISRQGNWRRKPPPKIQQPRFPKVFRTFAEGPWFGNTFRVSGFNHKELVKYGWTPPSYKKI